MHANVDFSWGEIHTFHGISDFSSGEIHLCPREIPHWWISPREKSKHACRCGFLLWRNPHIPWNFRFLPRRNPVVPKGNPPIGGFLPRGNPNMHANVDFSRGEIHTFHGISDFSSGEIHLFPREIPHWWISPREKSRHACK